MSGDPCSAALQGCPAASGRPEGLRYRTPPGISRNALSDCGVARVTLPCEPQPELQVPGVVGQRNRADRRVRDVRVRRAEVVVVEQIEHLRAELRARAADREPL